MVKKYILFRDRRCIISRVIVDILNIANLDLLFLTKRILPSKPVQIKIVIIYSDIHVITPQSDVGFTFKLLVTLNEMIVTTAVHLQEIVSIARCVRYAREFVSQCDMWRLDVFQFY